jgi:hypothetical protein
MKWQPLTKLAIISSYRLVSCASTIAGLRSRLLPKHCASLVFYISGVNKWCDCSCVVYNVFHGLWCFVANSWCPISSCRVLSWELFCSVTPNHWQWQIVWQSS